MPLESCPDALAHPFKLLNVAHAPSMGKCIAIERLDWCTIEAISVASASQHSTWTAPSSAAGESAISSQSSAVLRCCAARLQGSGASAALCRMHLSRAQMGGGG